MPPFFGTKQEITRAFDFANKIYISTYISLLPMSILLDANEISKYHREIIELMVHT